MAQAGVGARTSEPPSAGEGKAQLDAQIPGSPSPAASGGLGSWGPVLRTGAGLGALIAHPRRYERSGGVSRPPVQAQGGRRLPF